MAGQVDFSTTESLSAWAKYNNVGLGTDGAKKLVRVLSGGRDAALYSTALLVTADAIPSVLVYNQGTTIGGIDGDGVIPLQQFQLLKDALDAKNATYRTILNPGYTHAQELTLSYRQAFAAVDELLTAEEPPAADVESGPIPDHADWGYVNTYTQGETTYAAYVYTNVTDAMTFTVPAGVTEIDYLVVGGGGAGGAMTAAVATAAAAIAAKPEKVTPPDDVAQALAANPSAREAYIACFTVVTRQNAAGQWVNVAELKPEVEAELQRQVDGGAAKVVDALADGTVTLEPVTPGFRYALEYGETLGTMTPQDPVIAQETSLTLPLPKNAGATSGFYRVKVTE